LSLIADIVSVVDPISNVEIKHATIIGSLKLDPFNNDLQEVKFLIDSGASRTTLSPYDVLALGIDWDHLPNSPFGCIIANGNKIFPKMLSNVEIHINRRDGKPRSEEVFELTYIHVMPIPKGKQIQKTSSILGMDILVNFATWQWDYTNNFLYLNRNL
jgi:hypothetical protein